MIDLYKKGKLKEEFNNLAKEHDVTRLFDNDEKSDNATKRLVLKLEEFKSIVEAASRLRAPYLLCKYLQEIAGDLHHFYNYTRVLSNDFEMTKNRLLIVMAVKTVMKQAFALIRVEAPEKM